MKWFGSITSHVLLALKHDEGIAPVGFALLVSLFIRVSVPDDANLARGQSTERAENGQRILTRSIVPKRPNSRSRSCSSAL